MTNEYRNIAIDTIMACWARESAEAGHMPSNKEEFQKWLANLVFDAVTRYNDIVNGGYDRAPENNDI